MASAAARGLYDGSRSQRTSKPLRRYIDLSESHISLLTRIFSNAPPYNLISTSPRHGAYAKITMELIERLPTILITPPPNKHLFGLFTSNNDQCLIPDPRRNDGRPFRELCDVHLRLQRPLTHSILRFVLDEVNFFMPKLFDFPFEPEHRSLFDRLINITSLHTRASDFEARWGRPPPPGWERQKNKCAGCILARIGSDADALVALGAVHRTRVREETYDFHTRPFWYDEWMRSLDAHDGEYLVEKSRALGSAMKRIVRKARKQADRLDEIDPDVSWAKKNPITSHTSKASMIDRPQRISSKVSETVANTSEHVSNPSRVSDEETLAKLSGTWIPSQRHESKQFANPASSPDCARSHLSVSSSSTYMDEDEYTNIMDPTFAKIVHNGVTYVSQPSRKNSSIASSVYSRRTTASGAKPRASSAVIHGVAQGSTLDLKHETVFVDNAPWGGMETKPRMDSYTPNWVDVCAYLNKMPTPLNDSGESSRSWTSGASEVSTFTNSTCTNSTCTNSTCATSQDEVIRHAYIDDDEDYPETPRTPRTPPRIQFSPESPSERVTAVTPDAFKRSLTQGLRPQPSMNTVSSGSVYSFYEGPYGERYNMPLPPPPKPLHVQKMSEGKPHAIVTPRQESFVLPPPPPRPDIKEKNQATNLRPESRLGRTNPRSSTSIYTRQPQVSRHVPSTRTSHKPQSAPRRPSAPPVMRTGIALGSLEFRRMLGAQEDEDDYLNDRRSPWMREFEWEQPHPATSQVFY